MQDVGVSRPAPCLSRPSHASQAVGLPPPRHGRVRCSGAQAATRRGAWKEWEWGRVRVRPYLLASSAAPGAASGAPLRALRGLPTPPAARRSRLCCSSASRRSRSAARAAMARPAAASGDLANKTNQQTKRGLARRAPRAEGGSARARAAPAPAEPLTTAEDAAQGWVGGRAAAPRAGVFRRSAMSTTKKRPNPPTVYSGWKTSDQLGRAQRRGKPRRGHRAARGCPPSSTQARRSSSIWPSKRE